MCNPIEPPLRSLFERITLLNGLLQVCDSQGQMALSLLRRRAGDDAAGLPDIWYGSRVLLEDIGDIPSDLWRRFAATQHLFLIKAENAEDEFGTINETIHLFLVAQAYESFETFLFNTAAHLHYALPATADRSKRLKWEKRNGPAASLGDWGSYVRDTYRGRDNVPLLNWLRALAPDLQHVEGKNTLRLPLRGWFAVASEIRHAATHSSGIVRRERFAGLLSPERGLLLARFPGEVSNGDYRLRLSTKAADDALQVFHNYGYAIHKSISVAHGLTPAYSTSVSQT